MQTCGGCGTRRAEWLESEGGRRDAYEPVVDRCPGCEQLAYARERHDDQQLGKGAFIKLRPRGGG